MPSSNRHVAMVVLVAFAANTLAGCTTNARYGTTGQAISAEPVACADDADQKLKRKLELRKITLEAKIDTAGSEIRVNDKFIAENTVTIESNTRYIKLLLDGLNYPPTDPAQPSAPGKKHLLDAIDDIGKFPATAVFKFGLYTLMAALEAVTLRAGGKLVARKLCLQTAVKQAEKVALTEATKAASAKALSMFGKFRSAFGRVRLVIQHTGSIAVPMKVKWDQKGDSWETWVPVIGTLKVGADNVGAEFSAWIDADAVKKNLKEQIDLIDAAQKTAQDEIKAAATDTATREKANVQLAEDIKKMKVELAKVVAALAKLGGNACSACDDGDGSGEGSDEIVVVASTDATSTTPAVAATTDADATRRVIVAPALPDVITGADGAGSGDAQPIPEPVVDYDAWTLDQLLADITLGTSDDDEAGGSADALIRDEFEECNADGECTPLP
jgi:hypothetical protein